MVKFLQSADEMDFPEAEWTVDKQANKLNKSLFGSARQHGSSAMSSQNDQLSKRKDKVKSVSSSNFANSDDEKLSKKEKKHLKEKQRKWRKKHGGGQTDNSFNSNNAKCDNKSAVGRLDNVNLDSEPEKRQEKRKHKLKDTDAEKGSQLPSKKRKVNFQDSICIEPTARKLKKHSAVVQQLTDQVPIDDSSPTKSGKKRKRKKKNNSKKNKYKHLALNSQENPDTVSPSAASGTETPANTLISESLTNTKKSALAKSQSTKKPVLLFKKQKHQKVRAQQLAGKKELHQGIEGCKKLNSKQDQSTTKQKSQRQKVSKMSTTIKDLKNDVHVSNSDGEDDADADDIVCTDSDIDLDSESDFSMDDSDKGDDEGSHETDDRLKDVYICKDLPKKSERSKDSVLASARDTKPSAPLSLADRAREKLNAARFRFLNEQLYTCTGKEALKMFKGDKDAFQVYHQGYQTQVSRWPLNPLDIIIKQLNNKNGCKVIADFGCGDGQLAETLSRKTVHSFDLVALKPFVTACDIAKVPVTGNSADAAVFCLSLMGTNLCDYLCEANRVLKDGGLLKIAEVVSRFDNVNSFVNNVQKLGFQLLKKTMLSKMFYLFTFRKVKDANRKSAPMIQLKPCYYKRR